MNRLFLSTAVIAVCAPVASAQWFEDFDSYTATTQVVGQGGWEEWSTGSGALVANAQSRTPANAIDINGPTDLVHQYSGYSKGTWVYKAHQFIPSGMTGTTYFVMLNTYAYPAGPYDWSVQVDFNSATGNVEANLGSAALITTPYVANQWAEFKFVIDLDQNWAKFYYNGVELDDPALPNHPTLGGGYAWSGGVFGGGSGAVNIAAVDLYANNATSVYYDDISLTRLNTWYEDFDAYAPTSQAVGQGGWEEWSTGSGAFVDNSQSRSTTNSIAIAGPSDFVHQYSGINTGKWVYRTWQFIPTGMTGTSYFILLNNYAYPAGPYSWSLQLLFNSATGMASANCGGGAVISMPYVANQWTEIKVVLDFTQDWVQLYYNGVLFDDPAVANHVTLGGGYRWSLGDFGTNAGGLVNLAAIDLYANNATAVYYDDFSLTPFECETFGLGCAGSMPASHLTCLHPARLGQTMLLQLNNLPASAAFVAIGFDNLMSPLGALPLDLGPFGMPGCKLRTTVDALQGVIGAGNTATQSLTIPNIAALVGLVFHEQALVPDAGAGNALGAVMSDAVSIRVGQ